MAGQPGRSGGKRAGAGRPKKAPPTTPQPPATPAADVPTDPLEFLKAVMTGTIPASNLQVRAAIAAAQYVHLKKGDGGKKDEANEKAQKAAGGKFGPAKAPLKLVNGR